MRPYLRAANVTWDGLDLSDVNEMNFPPSQLDEFRLEPDDILLSEASGSVDEVGKPALWRGEIENCCFQNTLIRVRSRGLDPRFLLLHFKGDAELGRFSKAARGVGIHHLGAHAMEEWPVCVPPVAEQRRIVDEVEKQFTRLDAAVVSLERVKASLKRYRASVLKAACEGQLVPTEAELARREGRSFESAEEMLKRILKERLDRWDAEQALRGRTADGSRAGLPRPSRYENPSPPRAGATENLPVGWVVTNLECLKEYSLYGPRYSSDDYVEDGVPVLRTTDISLSGRVNLKSAPRLRLSNADLKRFKLERGDLVVTRTGSLGTLAVFDDAVDAIPGAYLIHYRLAAPLITSWYISFVLRSPAGQRRLLSGGAGVGRPNLNAPTIDSIELPLPPLAEQHRIVAEVERRLSVVDELEATVEKNLARCARLRQSILKRAFEGRLVPQDPNDEPASVLLERIRRGREGAVEDAAPSRRNGGKRAVRPRRVAR